MIWINQTSNQQVHLLSNRKKIPEILGKSSEGETLGW